MSSLLVTGGAGFIGSAVVRRLIRETGHRVVNLDALTYAGNPASLAEAGSSPRHTFIRGDIRDADLVRRIFEKHRPSGVLHLAAESHVDRSIDGPRDFIETNLLGTFTLLEEARRYLHGLPTAARDAFRFVHISTDEVFGTLGAEGHFTEETAYAPSSPYSASKAGSDHLVRAWHRTYGVPVVVANCSNNYGPYQFPEKLIPLMILHALEGRPLPVYGRGDNVRDWLYGDDHAAALLLLLERGAPGSTYCIGGGNERTNLEVVRAICAILDELRPDPATGPRERLIRFVDDRPGHDHRYAIDASRLRREIGWEPRENFDTGLRRTVEWYLANPGWVEGIRSGAYRGERLGLGEAALAAERTGSPPA